MVKRIRLPKPNPKSSKERLRLPKPSLKPSSSSPKKSASKPKPKLTTDVRSLAELIAEIIGESNPYDVFDACIAVLAANDITWGDPHWTMTHGYQQVRGEVYYQLSMARLYITKHGRMPTTRDLLRLRAQHSKVSTARPYRLTSLN